jgi:hypothetical protein
MERAQPYFDGISVKPRRGIVNLEDLPEVNLPEVRVNIIFYSKFSLQLPIKYRWHSLDKAM